MLHLHDMTLKHLNQKEKGHRASDDDSGHNWRGRRAAGLSGWSILGYKVKLRKWRRDQKVQAYQRLAEALFAMREFTRHG
jgi:hypothetical protein